MLRLRNQLCIIGSYCTGGRITGPCAAGYFCIVNMSIPNPDNSLRPDGGLCPYGYYCPEGKCILLP